MIPKTPLTYNMQIIMPHLGAYLLALALFLIQILFSFSTTAFTNISTDQSALLALKSQLTLDPYHILSSNWTASTSVCTWVGVSCGSRHHRVTALDISSMGLAGNLPLEVGNLSFLVSFNLSSNYFRGNLPQEMSRLRRLQFIDLAYNNFTGELPSWIHFLAQLKFLKLRNNSFSGLLPNSITNISKLETLDLSFNPLHGEIPEGIGNIENLKELALQYNGLSGTIPVQVFNISKLERLNLRENSFSGALPTDMCRGIPRIQELRLAKNEIGGLIPSTIFQCSHLRVLRLAFNQFTGSIPREIGNLSALEMLYLGDNNIAGEIPAELGNIWNLKEFDIGNNHLTGSIPGSIFNITCQLEQVYFHGNKLVGQLLERIGECSKLQILTFYENNITGIIPSTIGNLTMLFTFFANHNSLIGTVPEAIGNLPNLNYLDLGRNSLSGLLPGKIFNISTLQVIDMSGNLLSGTLPNFIGYGLPNLGNLYLRRNIFSGRIPESISNASSLVDIDFSYNNFSGSFPDSFGKLRFLQRLYLDGNKFISESREMSIVTSLTNCPDLKLLTLGGNPTLNVTLPVTIGNLSSFLQYVYIHEAGIFGNIPNEIFNLRSLILLDLSENHLTGSIPHNLTNLHKLQILSVDGNKLSGMLPNDICELPSLEMLSLPGNQIEGSIPDCIGALTTLRHLYIDDNKLSSAIPTNLWKLNDLIELGLSSNLFTGYLPHVIGNMKALLVLNLSNNRFSSNIPDAIGNLQNLKNLSLANNRFTGSIPESMGNMFSLVNLNMSHNNLSGNIPNSLQSLRDLSSFDVSFNELNGKIPANGRFRNFDSQSFASNEGLCGDPRYGVPTCPDTHNDGSKRRKLVTAAVCALLGVTLLASVTILVYIVVRHRRKNAPLTQTGVQIETAPTRVSYYDIANSTEGFNESHLIGVGGFSSVYKGILRDGKHVAIKVLDLKVEGAYKNFDIECELLSSLKHRNLCKIVGVCSNESFKCLVLEYMPNGSLEKLLYSEDCFLDIMQRVSVMIDVACALEYLHHGYSVQVVHRDLKPSNILLDEDMIAHLSDFGISKLLNEGDSIAQTNTIATFGYMAPEYGSEGLVSVRCDVYSYGILLMEVFTRTKPSNERFEGDLSLKGLVHDSWPNELMQVIDSRLLRQDEELQVIDSKLLRQDEELFHQTLECFSSIMELALKCSIESPNLRINMMDVVVQLKKIQMKLNTSSGDSRRRYGSSIN